MIQTSPYRRGYETDSFDSYLRTIRFYDEKQMKLAITKALTYPEDYEAYKLPFLDDNFRKLVDQFLENGGNPNLTFTEIEIGTERFHHATFFHVVYIYWKTCASDDSSTDKIFENIIDCLLRDKRVDVRAKFTEENFPGRDHFEVLDEKYYDQNIAEGFCLERITIAHYALVKKDLSTLEKILDIAPDLLETPCCFTRGKDLLHNSYILKIADLTQPILDKVRADYPHWDTNRKGVECFSIGGLLKNDRSHKRNENKRKNDRSYEINENKQKFDNCYYTLLDLNNKRLTGELVDNIAGELAVVEKINPDTSEKMLVSVTRIARVTLMHLAARSGNRLACGFLRGRKVIVPHLILTDFCLFIIFMSLYPRGLSGELAPLNSYVKH